LVLRDVEHFDATTLIAIVDAAARWLEPFGDEYAWAILGAVTDAPNQTRVYGELVRSVGGQ